MAKKSSQHRPGGFLPRTSAVGRGVTGDSHAPKLPAIKRPSAPNTSLPAKSGGKGKK
jgi:hypothetical protein